MVLGLSAIIGYGEVPSSEVPASGAYRRHTDQQQERPAVLSELDVVVLGGGGHVGLPLSLVFAAGRALRRDLSTSTSHARAHRPREMPFLETGADDATSRDAADGPARLSDEPAILARSTTIIVVVIGTPVDEFLGPSMTIFERAVDQISPHLQDGALVVLRSTVYPGTTEYVTQHLAAREAIGGRRLLPRADR